MRLRIGIVVLLSALVSALPGAAPAQAADLSVTITSPANGSTGPSDISVTGTSNADPSAYRLVLEVNGEDRYGTLRADGSWEMVYQQFDYGWSTLCAQIRNLDLNVTYASYCSAYRVLPPPLELYIISPYDGALVDPTVTISGYVNYVQHQGLCGRKRADSAERRHGRLRLRRRLHRRRHVQHDLRSDGHLRRTATASVTFTVDGTPPSTPVVTSPSPKKIITTKSFTIAGTGEPLTHVRIQPESGQAATTDIGVDGTWAHTFGPYELESYYTGRRTPFTFTVAGYDNAGNFSPEASYTYTLKIAP
jgi:hypothetical protein